MAGIKIVAGQFGDEGNDWVRRLKKNYADRKSVAAYQPVLLMQGACLVTVEG